MAKPMRLMLLSAVLPGGGLVLLGRCWLGMALGLVFAGGVNVGLYRWLLAPAGDGWLGWLAGLLAAGGWCGSLVLTVVGCRRERSSAAEREALFREGLVAYLRSDYESALGAFRAVLRLCPRDVEAHLKLAMVQRARGAHREAVAELRRCRFYDDRDTWRWEVERELAELARPVSSRRSGPFSG